LLEEEKGGKGGKDALDRTNGTGLGGGPLFFLVELPDRVGEKRKGVKGGEAAFQSK